MKMIKKIADHIHEELCGAQEYAECYVEQKVSGNAGMANRFKDMANDELKHAMYMHEYAVEQINKYRNVVPIPAEMLEKWEETHKEYVDRYAWIKKMLEM